jgi:adhesin transport system outer membrane protein
MDKKAWLLGAVCLPLCMSAQGETFKEAAQRALISNPDIQARVHALKASKEERSVAAGGYFPRVDLQAGVSREHRDDPLLVSNFRQHQTTITLTQMLYDGFATKNEVERLDHATLVRFYELRDTSENTTLEILRAYEDVLRYRELVAYAEENYVQHRALFEQLQRKAKAGVARGVDLETASGRLALAESNLLTEAANLHDVTARFQRITGFVPAKDLGAVPALSQRMPANPKAAITEAVAHNPSMMAAVENIRSNDSAMRGKKASFQPRLDFQMSSTRGENLSGYTGTTSNHSAGLVMSWNLFSGGSDLARSRQQAEQINTAKDLLDKACRDTRQTLVIAYNDVRKLTEQINYLDQHQLSTEKTRDAYRKQFDIGQRTLLDLLDTENELFEARRAYVGASHDLTIAYGRVAASMGVLISSLGLADQPVDALPELARSEDGYDPAARCPAEAPGTYGVDKAALDARAAELAKQSLSVSQPAPAAPPQK